MIHNFVISMPTAEKRRAHIQQQFGSKHIPFQFFDARTPSDELSRYLLKHLPNVLETPNLTMGEKGCLASHFMLWQKCVDEKLDYITIFEDDILLGENAESYLTTDHWLKERFNFNEFFVLRLETFLMPVETESSPIDAFLDRNIDVLKSKHFGTAGYIISRGAARYLLDLFKNMPKDEIKAIDEIMFNKLIDTDRKYKVYQLNPALCVQELQYHQENSLLNSDLQKDRKRRTKKENKKTLKQRLIRIKENILRAINKKKWEDNLRKKEMKNKTFVRFL